MVAWWNLRQIDLNEKFLHRQLNIPSLFKAVNLELRPDSQLLAKWHYNHRPDAREGTRPSAHVTRFSVMSIIYVDVDADMFRETLLP